MLGAVAVGALLAGYLLLTPDGHQLVSTTVGIASGLGNAVVTAVGFFLQILATSLAIMAISFKRIDTLTGFVIFIFSMFGNIALALEIVQIVAWFSEKVKNVIKP